MVDPVDNNRGAARVGGVLATLLLVALVFIVGVWVGGHPRQVGVDRLPSALRDRLIDEERTALSTQVLSILEHDYYKPIDRAKVGKLEDSSVKSLVTALGDPYTQYLDPEEYKSFLNARAGTYVGVGVEWHPEGEAARVIRVSSGGPADRAGIKAADLIVAVDGKAVSSADSFAAMQTVKGAEGTKVTLRIARKGQAERDYTMTRAEIHERVIDTRIETVGAKRIGYVRLDRFTSGSAKAFKAAVKKHVEQKVDGIAFDLRDDPGGLVDEAVGIASVFLSKGAPVATTKSRSGTTDTLKAEGGAVDTSLPLVLIVDTNSASASEIVAGALRDAGRAKLVGTHTFGKALIQTTRTLANGGAIKYTTASYLTPNGFDLGAKGLPPDVDVKDDPKTPADEALARALAVVAAR